MMLTDPPPTRGEWVTARGIDMLDELGLALFECQFALRNMRIDVGLTLDELQRDLRRAQDSARLAFEAASLLHQGAQLSSSWTDYPSRPKAIVARHRVAVDYGAPQAIPDASTAQRCEESLLRPVPRQRPSAPGRRCANTSEPGGTPCRRRPARIGPDVFATHCPDHLDAAERRLFDDHLREMAAIIVKAQRQEFARICEEWLSRRRGVRHWLEQAVGLDDGPP